MTKIEFCEHDGTHVRNAEIPSEWDEMTAAQVRFVARRYDAYVQGEISALRLNVEILYNLLGLKFRAPEGTDEQKSKVYQNIYALCEKSLSFLFEKEGDGPMRLTFKSVQNPMPTVRGGRARTSLLIGPASLLQDLTFGEFRQASAALNSFFQSSEMSDLDECIAFLYRPRSMHANRAGRKVKPVDPAGFGKDVETASHIEPWQKTLIMLWFASCINYLQTGSLRLNGEDVDLALLFSGGNAKGPAFTWNDLLVQIARDQTIGNLDRVDEEPLISILSIMWTNYKEGKRNEQAQKS